MLFFVLGVPGFAEESDVKLPNIFIYSMPDNEEVGQDDLVPEELEYVSPQPVEDEELFADEEIPLFTSVEQVNDKEYDEFVEDANSIFLKDEGDNYVVNLRVPQKITSNHSLKLENKIHNERLLNLSKYSKEEYNISGKSVNSIYTKGGFSIGTTYDSSIDKISMLENSTKLFTRYERERFALSSAYEKTMNTTLLIMAAGIGSRFGTGIKQLEPVDDANHIIMDYSIHDAIEAGFNHVVFIIRKDIEKEFKEVIGDRIDSICSSHNVTVDYAFQDINDIPGTMPEGRTKPWGTGQAVLAAKNVIDTPFIVINADDYYGKEGFKAVHEYLVNGGKSCMAGFVLKNTLSDNGGVTRGICKMDDQNNLTEVVETKNIVKTATGAEADGVAVDVNSLVSMNMWGLTPEFLDVLEGGFKEFFKKEVPGNPLKAEYLIPIFVGELLEQGKMSVKVLRTNDTWYGMTYHEDVAAVKDSFKKMLENGVYKADLFSDL